MSHTKFEVDTRFSEIIVICISNIPLEAMDNDAFTIPENLSLGAQFLVLVWLSTEHLILLFPPRPLSSGVRLDVH